MGSFEGFSKETIAFLRGLRENNEKEWFEAHRADYDEHAIGLAKDFVVAAGDALLDIASAVQAEPKVNGSIFRINRDTRFSKDKTPYKDHLDFWFWEGSNRKAAKSGFFFRIQPDSVGIGVGAHGFDPDTLTAYRDAVVDGERGPALAAAVAAVEALGWEVKGEHYKRLPRGYEAEGRLADLLRYNALWTGHDEPVPDVLFSAAIVDYCVDKWSQCLPLHRWIVDTL